MNKYNSNSDWFNPLNAGVTADLDPPADFGPPGPDPLADMDPLSRIWTPLKISVLLSKIGKIVFLELLKRQNKNIEAVFLFK